MVIRREGGNGNEGYSLLYCLPELGVRQNHKSVLSLFFPLIFPYFLNNQRNLKQTPNNKFRVHLVVLLESTSSIESVFEEKSDT